MPHDCDIPRTDGAEALLAPGSTVWAVERAERAAVLVDAAAYFGAAREAMLAAERTIHIVGWDLDSRVRLVGPSGTADDGLPETLAEFLSALVARKPELRIRLLLWDYSMLFSFERELAPTYSFLWNTPPEIEICLDDVLPIGASHHQKLVVVDDRIAFSGGLDLTQRRWDTPEHRPDDPRRLDPAGSAYEPFHDVQMLVDGAVAQRLGELVRARWERAAEETLADPAPLPQAEIASDPWPPSVTPDFHAVDIGIARTAPRFRAEPEVREVEALFFAMVDRVERFLYIENQFLTCVGLADRLARRMLERPELEVVAVVPRSHDGWFEQQTMLVGRGRFAAILAEAGVADRFRMVYPEVAADGRTAAVMVHAKVTVADDTILRIGSANLCNRSMGLDSECDLVIEAVDTRTREKIADIRNGLLAEHLGLDPAAVADAVARDGGFLGLVDAGGEGPRRLLPVADAVEAGLMSPVGIDAIGDPLQPLEALSSPEPGPGDAVAAFGPAGWLRLALGLAAVTLAVIAWRYSPLSEPTHFAAALAAVTASPWQPLVVVLAFVAGGLVAFPLTVLIVATVTIFDGWSGAMLAGLGAMSSAVATYGVGRRLGAGPLRRYIGPRINRIRTSVERGGVLAVAAVRLVPIAPFTMVNLVAGAAEVRFVDYVVGSALGLVPGLFFLSAFGDRLVALFAEPSAGEAALVGGLLLLWLLLSVGLQIAVRRCRRQPA